MSLVRYQGKYADINFNTLKYDNNENALIFCDLAKLEVDADADADVLVDDNSEYLNFYDLANHLFVSCLQNSLFVFSPLCGKGVVYANNEKNKITLNFDFDNIAGTELVMLPLFFPFKRVFTNIALTFGNAVDTQIEVKNPLACADETWQIVEIKDRLYVAFKLET